MIKLECVGGKVIYPFKSTWNSIFDFGGRIVYDYIYTPIGESALVHVQYRVYYTIKGSFFD